MSKTLVFFFFLLLLAGDVIYLFIGESKVGNVVIRTETFAGGERERPFLGPKGKEAEKEVGE